jgi:AraC family transcriptional regulator, transcriptional activator FtrA
MDLCPHLVRRDHGSAIANVVARRLVVPPHRDGGQAQFVTTPVPAQDGHPGPSCFPG